MKRALVLAAFVIAQILSVTTVVSVVDHNHSESAKKQRSITTQNVQNHKLLVQDHNLLLELLNKK